MRSLFLIALLTYSLPNLAFAETANFSGKWYLDLRKGEELKRDDICGGAGFDLRQEGENVFGSHYFYSVGCGRLNEGGDSTVRGVVIGNKAALVVTSARNGAVALGVAEIRDSEFMWELSDFIASGKPEGDALILNKGVLQRK